MTSTVPHQYDRFTSLFRFSSIGFGVEHRRIFDVMLAGYCAAPDNPYHFLLWTKTLFLT